MLDPFKFDPFKEKNRRLLKTYGITYNEWLGMYSSQRGLCYICRKAHPRLCVDHIHVKGFKKMPPEEKKKYVRGLLCFMCNTSIKCVEKTINGERNRQQLEGMVKYFIDFKLKGEL